ncbi:hypothetical protein AMTRI_Chr11g150930 [Amborella trichopoda]
MALFLSRKLEILSHLPIREAGRTSILSKRWRDVWASTPSFNAVEDCTPGFLANRYEWLTRIEWAGPSSAHWKDSWVSAGSNPNSDHLDLWVNYLSRKDLQELTIKFLTEPDEYSEQEESEYVNYAPFSSVAH